jgi:hypothetical protein
MYEISFELMDRNEILPIQMAGELNLLGNVLLDFLKAYKNIFKFIKSISRQVP